MCGRFTLKTYATQLAKTFQVENAPDLTPRYNIAPTQDVAVVRLTKDGDQRELSLLRWGLIPSWAKDPKIGNRMINARGEAVSEKPSSRAAFKKRRCLILANGFYEWQKVDEKKQPYFIHQPDDEPFAFAGLWEYWAGEGQEIQSCTIITTTANSLMEPLHDRMPVILAEAAFPVWLVSDFQNKEALNNLLRPCDADLLEAYPVKTVVNNPRNAITLKNNRDSTFSVFPTFRSVHRRIENFSIKQFPACFAEIGRQRMGWFGIIQPWLALDTKPLIDEFYLSD